MTIRLALIAVVVCTALACASCRRAADAEAPQASEQTPSAITTIDPAAKHVTLHAQPDELLELVPPSRPPQDIALRCVRVEAAPTIDGVLDDAAWDTAEEIVTLERSSHQKLRLRAVRTDDAIFVAVSWADAAPSETHRSWVWDAAEGIYKQGEDREDACVLKWSMTDNNANLSLYRNPQPHVADIWFWKACRTNPAGYADDKRHVLDGTPGEETSEVATEDGGVLHLHRVADEGQAAYKDRFIFEYETDVVTRYGPQAPTGSRGDIRAKGTWRDGEWTVEFGRSLDTGHDDDVALAAGRTYLLGVACHEMAYEEPRPEWTQPLYRTGDVYDRLLLTLDP